MDEPLEKWTMWLGYATAFLFAAGNAIWALEMPEDGTPIPEILAFYEETADRIVVGGSLSLLSIGVFVAFAAALRQQMIGRGSSRFLASAAFGGGLLAMSAGIGAESINLAAALRAQDDALTPDLAQSLFEISQVLGSASTGIGLGVFAIATALADLRGRSLMPRPVAIGALVIGFLLLTPLAHLNWLSGAALVVVSSTLAFWAGRDGSRPAQG